MGILRAAGQKATAQDQNQYYGFADVTQTTVTQAVTTNLSTPYTIPANEPAVNSAYTMKVGGSGTWGATQQNLAFTVAVGGVVVVTNVVLGAQAFAANASFRWSGEVRVTFSAIGVNGACFSNLIINLSEIANNIAPPATVNQANLQANATYGLGDANAAASAAIDTTSNMVMVLKCAWGNTTGAPTITNRSTIFNKVA